MKNQLILSIFLCFLIACGKDPSPTPNCLKTISIDSVFGRGDTILIPHDTYKTISINSIWGRKDTILIFHNTMYQCDYNIPENHPFIMPKDTLIEIDTLGHKYKQYKRFSHIYKVKCDS